MGGLTMIKGIRALISNAAQKADVPPQYLYGLIMALSRNNSNPEMFYRYDKRRDESYIGIAQIPYNKALEIHLNKRLYEYIGYKQLLPVYLFDVRLNVFLSAFLLRDIYDRSNNWKQAIYEYHTEEPPEDIKYVDEDMFVNNVLKESKKWFVE